MKRIKNKLLALILTVIYTAFCTISSYASQQINSFETVTEDNIDGELAKNYVNQAISLILLKYKFDITKEELYRAALEKIISDNPELMEDAFKALFDSLDDHTSYYTNEEFEKFLSNMTNEICGIGVLVTESDSGLLINQVYNNSPAKESGIKIGDVITAVNGISIAGVDLDIAKSYVAGAENTPVTLTILRQAASFDVTALRQKVIVEPGFYQSVEDDTIGYIALYDFYEHGAEFVSEALSYFDSKNISDIILDLRNNPGGSVTTMVAISSLFIPTGPAIHFEFKNPANNKTLYAANNNPKYNLAVLVNENSASASEAFSAAVQDTGVGIIVGTDTFGKGTMQNITEFKIGGGIKMTEAEFLSPNKRRINGIGVGPDVYVEDKIVDYSKSDYNKITYERVMKDKDLGTDVLALEERLYFLGYEIGIPDEVYDSKTKDAVTSFQLITGLYPYGVADITTQLKIEEILIGTEVCENNTYKRAVEIFKNENWKDYIFQLPTD